MGPLAEATHQNSCGFHQQFLRKYNKNIYFGQKDGQSEGKTHRAKTVQKLFEAGIKKTHSTVFEVLVESLIHLNMRCSKFGWNWSSGSGEEGEKLTDRQQGRQTDRQTKTTDNWQ